MPDARFLLNEGRRGQQVGALERALDCYHQAIDEASDPVLAAEGWRRVSSVHRARCDWQAALEAVHRSRALLRAADDPDALAETLNAEAAVHIHRGEFGVARPLLEEATELARSDRALGITLQNLGFVSARTGDLDGAERYFQVSAAHFHRAGYRWGEACVLGNHAAVALDRQDYELADTTAQRAIEVAREIEDLNLLAMATMNRAEARAALGDLGCAEDLASEALGYFGASGEHSLQVQVYRLLGDISVKRSDTATARRCYEKGLEMAQRLQVQLESRELSARLVDIAEPEVRVGRSAAGESRGSPEAPPPA